MNKIIFFLTLFVLIGCTQNGLSMYQIFDSLCDSQRLHYTTHDYLSQYETDFGVKMYQVKCSNITENGELIDVRTINVTVKWVEDQ